MQMNIHNIIIGAALIVAAPFAKAQHMATDAPLVHDPVMAYEDGTYYLYCTGHDINQMTSTDGKLWNVSRRGVLDGRVPAWTHDSVPGFENHIWAPDVIRYRDKWYLAYSCSTFGKNTSAIGLLSNSSLADADGWKDEGCIVASQMDRDNWNAIDPNFIIDEQGNPWMTFGSFWDGIQMVRLDNTMHIAKGEKTFTIARRYNASQTSAEPNPTSEYAGTNAIEAPFIFFHDGYYYLFVSWDYCCRGAKSNYRVAVGRSKSVAGPYLDRDGKDMRDGGGTLFTEGDKKEFEAMGHCSVYNFEGRDSFFCHGYRMDGSSVLVKYGIKWERLADGTGWPVKTEPPF